MTDMRSQNKGLLAALRSQRGWLAVWLVEGGWLSVLMVEGGWLVGLRIEGSCITFNPVTFPYPFSQLYISLRHFTPP